MREEQQKRLAEVEQLKRDFLNTFNSDSGKKILKHLENSCFWNRTTYPNSPNDFNRLAFNEGQRSVVLHIKNMMNFNIDKIRKLVIEKGEE